MNAEDAKRKGGKGRFKGCSICLFCLILGFLLGVALDALFRPNSIYLAIQQDGKVSLSPQTGDIINWTSAVDPSAPVQISFPVGPIPCRTVSSATMGVTCVFDPVDNGPGTFPRLFLYGCSFSSNNTPCYDPLLQIGPRCPGCPPVAIQGSPGHKAKQIWDAAGWKIKQIWDAIGWDFKRLFGLSRGERMVPRNQSGSTGTTVTNGLDAQGSGTKVSAPPASAAPARVIDVVAACNNGVAAVFDANGPVVKNTISAEQGDRITWIPYAPYTITFADPTACLPSSLTETNQSCVIQSLSGKPQYTLNMPSCTANPTTEYVQLPNAVTATKPAGK
jgi:hypothetical protein